MKDTIDDWEPCPRCRSNKVTKHSKWENAGVMFGASCIFGFIGILLWPLLIIGLLGLLFSIVMLFIAPSQKDKYKCKDCDYEWPVKKEQSPESAF